MVFSQYGGAASAAACSYVYTPKSISILYDRAHCVLDKLTGGFSSTSSPATGFALMFANTPSVLPPPYILPVRVAGGKTGNCVTRRSTAGRSELPLLLSIPVASVTPSATDGLPLNTRCRSSSRLSAFGVTSSASDSSSEGESNVSCNVRSVSWTSGVRSEVAV